MSRKVSKTNKTAGQDAVQRQRPTGPTAASKPVLCESGKSVCVDQWHRLARWMEENAPLNWQRMQKWLRALHEDAEAPRTFEAAPGLSLVWSGAKIEVKTKSLRTPMARRTSEANEAAQPDAVQRKCPTEEGAKPGVSAQPSDELVDKYVEAFFDSFDCID